MRALGRFRPQTRAADSPAQAAGREPESGLGIIAFDDVGPWPIVLVARNPVGAVPFFIDDDAVLAQAVEGHVNVAARFQRRRTAQDRVAVEKGQGHEQAREELGTDIAGQGIRPGLQGPRYGQGQGAFRRFISDALFIKEFIIRRQRPFGQAAVAGKSNLIAAEDGDGNEEAQGRSRFIGIDGQRLALRLQAALDAIGSPSGMRRYDRCNGGT